MVQVLAAARNVDYDDVGILTCAFDRVRSSSCVAGDCIVFVLCLCEWEAQTARSAYEGINSCGTERDQQMGVRL